MSQYNDVGEARHMVFGKLCVAGLVVDTCQPGQLERVEMETGMVKSLYNSRGCTCNID